MDYVSKMKEILKAKKVSYEELSEITGKSRNTISNYMTRKSSPDIEFINTVARHFNLPLSSFFDENNSWGEAEEKYQKMYLEDRLAALERDMKRVKKNLDMD